MFNRQKPLSAQVIVITGATSGIGLATAREAARAGAKLVLAARNADALAEVAADLRRDGAEVAVVTADVGNRSEVEAIAEAAIARFGGFDTWVNNAGQTIFGRLTEVSDEDHQQLIKTNFWGTVHGSLTAVRHLRDRGGALVNVGSVGSDFAFPFQGMYSASKHAIRGFTDALRMELEQERAPISVTLIKPASIDSPLPQRSRNYLDREPKLPPPAYRPREVARAILSAATTPRRDIYVGGGGRLISIAANAAPSLFDKTAPAIMLLQKRFGRPRHPEGGLHATIKDGEERGTYPGVVMPVSLYNRALDNPLATATLVAGGVALLGLASLLRGPALPRGRSRRSA